jgi:outer membrane protein OmpA-like peptidoglycan-associated protein
MNYADTMNRITAATAFAATMLLWASSTLAQAPASETFEPQAVDSTSIWSTATSDVAPHLTPTAVLVAHWANDPVVLQRRGDDAPVARLVDDQYKAEIGLGVGLFERLELGLVLPLAFQRGDASTVLPEANSVDLAQARAHMRASIFQSEHVGVGAQVTGYLPTSQDAPYQSNTEPTALASLIADYRRDGDLPWRVAANVGWVFAPQSDGLIVADDQLDARLAAEVELFPDTIHVLASTYGRWQALAEPRDRLSGGYLGGARVVWGRSGLSSTIGAGGGLGGGYGTPVVRIVASVAYKPSTEDLDRDGRTGENDRCPEAGEDIDGYEDADGCPDPDNDRDEIADTDDDCPNEPEDVDGFEDDDGCPDPDNDGDGISDFADACPDEPGKRDLSGCPFVDDDGDGIDASVDQCPNEAEDLDDFEDADGCPDPDNDRDGIADKDDQCPDVPESINGVDDADGCPDEGESAVRLAGDRIEILERVYFDTNKATIKKRSHSVLEQVASVMEANPDIRLLRVQGHTDARGDEQHNLELSQRRAVSVKEFLLEQGVDAERLSARGYGETHPIADNDTKEGRAENRRVEFHIIERGQL